jgi:type VI protein secretion system component VasK
MIGMAEFNSPSKRKANIAGRIATILILLAIVGGIVGYFMWHTGVTNAQNAKFRQVCDPISIILYGVVTEWDCVFRLK